MTLLHNLITLNTSTPVMLTTTVAQEGDYGRELDVSIQNLHSSHFVFIGDSSVSTSSYGFRIDPGQTFTATLNTQDEIYAVTDTGTTSVGVIRVIRNG
jgi:hypothetical protein